MVLLRVRLVGELAFAGGDALVVCPDIPLTGGVRVADAIAGKASATPAAASTTAGAVRMRVFISVPLVDVEGRGNQFGQCKLSPKRDRKPDLRAN